MKKLLAALALTPALAFGWGVTNDNVTQGNIGITVCVPHYTDGIRPPLSYTNRLKGLLLAGEEPARRCLQERLDTSHDWQKAVTLCHRQLPYVVDMVELSAYELDHQVPLAVGGHPYDPNNLVLQPWPAARQKDTLERAAQADLCSGRATLAQVRARFLRSGDGHK